MDKKFIGILVAILVVFAGIMLLGDKKSEAPTGGKEDAKLLTNHVKGNADAKVTILEYGDFQCPYCQQYNTTINQVVETNKDKVKFQFRNFPLMSMHKNAFAAARAAEAASLQNKFWEMHDALYESTNWQIWTNASSPTNFFEQYAKQIGLNVEQFKTDFSSTKVNDTINADLNEAKRLDITGTPTFYVNGKKTQINNDPAEFQKVIDAELAKQN